MNDEQNVFIPTLEIQRAAKESFVREGKISFVLTKRDARKIDKQLKFIRAFLSTRKGSLGMFGMLSMASRLFLLKAYVLFFNERLNNAHEFFENNYKQIDHYEKSIFSRNNKLMVITFYAAK